MNKKVKIYLDALKPPHGWIRVKNFSSFVCLLETIPLSDIEAINFSDNLEDDDEDTLGGFSGSDCAIKLVEVAKTRKLPQCFVHDGSKEISKILDHYTKSYNFDNYAILTEKIN